MFEIKEALSGNVVLTVTDSRGVVVLHETVREEDAQEIAERAVRSLK